MTETLTHNEAYHAVHEADERLMQSTAVQAEGLDLESIFQAHPLGVKPSGNALTSNENAATSIGGFGRLPDETILTLLEWLDSESLLQLGASCRSFFAYGTTDQLWKDLFIQYADSFSSLFEHQPLLDEKLWDLVPGLKPSKTAPKLLPFLHRVLVCSY